MNPDFQKQIDSMKDDIARLKTSDEATANVLNYHTHTSFDQTNKLDLQQQIRFRRIKLVDQAIITSDASIGNHFYVTLTGSHTIGNPIGAAPGQRILYEFIQDSTGSRVLTLGSKFNKGAFTITLTTTVNKRDFLEVVYSDVDDIFYIINFVKEY